ncbi:MAG: hypothetical protein OEW39_03675 [Deltaproteobacteria bacterium]|nr:hypothetical protein [Deltaproteobacteria bacterium]
MKPKTLTILALILVFVVGVAVTFMRELDREQAEVDNSISGVVEVAPMLYAQGVVDIVRTDRIVLFLVDPATRQPVAMTTESPLVPPQNIRIGQMHSREGTPLKGSYLLVGITDKDGEIFKITPGEVYGASPQPIAMGAEQVRLVLDQPFQGSLFNEPGVPMAMHPSSGGAPNAEPTPPGNPAGGAPAGGPMMGGAAAPARPLGAEPEGDPRFTIQGTITASAALKDNVTPKDRLIVMLFDPEVMRPVSIKMIPHALLPQKFSITLPQEAQARAKKAYSLRVITDKNDSPFQSAPGELVGRSAQPIPLGTRDLKFELNEVYTR